MNVTEDSRERKEDRRSCHHAPSTRFSPSCSATARITDPSTPSCRDMDDTRRCRANSACLEPEGDRDSADARNEAGRLEVRGAGGRILVGVGDTSGESRMTALCPSATETKVSRSEGGENENGLDAERKESPVSAYHTENSVSKWCCDIDVDCEGIH